MGGLITLTTDFGLADPYVGIMKGVMLSISPAVHIVDISHQVPPQDIACGAYTIAATYRYFPPGTVHVVVVDPGVGSDRRGIAVWTPAGTFVAPDNGVLTYVFDQEVQCKAVELTESAYWLSPTSATFHGRDIFAPVAAHLASGLPLSSLGPPAANLTRIPISRPLHHPDGTIEGRIIHIDRHGNLITNIPWQPDPTRDRSVEVAVAGQVIRSVSHTFSSVGIGEWVAYVGSGGTLEIAIREGNAAQTLNVSIGGAVTVTGFDR